MTKVYFVENRVNGQDEINETAIFSTFERAISACRSYLERWHYSSEILNKYFKCERKNHWWYAGLVNADDVLEELDVYFYIFEYDLDGDWSDEYLFT